MHNKIKTSFSIKDLENLSGIKAHTIRIWEKRYGMLAPERSDTNIRRYDSTNLKRLLNISYLNNQGLKISKIAELSDSEMNIRVNDFISNKDPKGHAHNMFKLAMLQFDEPLFNATYNELLATTTFRDVFTSVFLELLDEIGLLWQTETITPAHEHFVSNLIKQKLLLNIERSRSLIVPNDKTYILYLPEDEVHELGLLYVYYELKLRGLQTIYLGQSVPQESLKDIQKLFSNLEFISSFTIAPEADNVESYLKSFHKELLFEKKQKLHILGRQAADLVNQPDEIKIYKRLTDFIDSI